MQPTEPSTRRSFLKEGLSIALGTAAALVPAAAGLTVILDPLRQRAGGAEFIRVASLDAIPADGVPRKFPVLANKVDAWTKSPNVPVGAVYISRAGEKDLKVLNVVCPHAGCFVDFVAEKKGYFCPCHNSLFAVDGKIADPKSPSPRDMDTLEFELRGGKEVWVKFRNYQAGHKEKVPV